MRIVKVVFWPENYLRNLISFVSFDLHRGLSYLYLVF